MMSRITIDVRDVQDQIREGAIVKVVTDSGETIRAKFDADLQQFVVSDIEPGLYEIIVQDEELEGETREVKIEPGENQVQFFLPEKGVPVYYQGNMPFVYDPEFQKIVIDYQQATDLNEPLTLELEGKTINLRPVLKKEKGDSPATQQVYELYSDEIDLSDITYAKQAIVDIAKENENIRQVSQVLETDEDGEPKVYTTDTMVITFKEGVDENEAGQIAAEICDGPYKLDYLPLSKNRYQLQLDNASYEVLEKAAAFENHDRVDRAEPSLVQRGDVDSVVVLTDPNYTQQENYLRPIEANSAWYRLYAAKNLAFGSPDVVIGILDRSTIVWQDNGQRNTHPDLAGNVTNGNSKLVQVWDIEENRDYTSLDKATGHSYAVTGLATAISNNGIGISGVAGNCRLISVGQPVNIALNLVTVAKAFVWMSGIDVPDFPAAPNQGVDIINNSWSPSDPNTQLPLYLLDVLQALSNQGRDNKGTVIVFSTGDVNRMVDNFPLHQNTGVLNIAASFNDHSVDYSGHGQQIDVCAPSSETTVTKLLVSLGAPNPFSGQIDTTLIGGTSAAAPLVSAALALGLSANPDLTRPRIIKLLHDSADHIDFDGGSWVIKTDDYPDHNHIPNFSPLYGYGQLNVGRLVRLALLTSQHNIYLQANENDDGNLFDRIEPAWDSPV